MYHRHKAACAAFLVAGLCGADTKADFGSTDNFGFADHSKKSLVFLPRATSVYVSFPVLCGLSWSLASSFRRAAEASAALSRGGGVNSAFSRADEREAWTSILPTGTNLPRN